MINLTGKKTGSTLFEIFLYAALLVAGICTLYPFLNVLAISLNDYIDTVKGGISIWPRIFTLKNYEHVLKNPLLLVGFRNSVLRTVSGSLISVICSTMFAYTLSRRDFIARKLFSMMLIITMYVSGGIIPGFLLMIKLNLMNNFLVYLIPGLISAWNVLVIRSYMSSLPVSLQESAKIDGANDFVIFSRIIIPLCIPVIATITLFCAVGQWNAWFDTFLYNSNNTQLTTLQYELRKILSASNLQAMQASTSSADQVGSEIKISPESIRMAITVVVTAPILLVYPFLQKYFVKGVTIGAVKG